MIEVKVFAGLDYHQSSGQACVLDENGKQLINRICCNDVDVNLAEASGSVRPEEEH